MKILNRYIFKELFSLLGILLLVFTFILLLWRIPFFSEMLLLGVPVPQVMALVGYMMPPVLAMSIPLSVLAATAMAFSRLSSDGEVTAMKAAGSGLYKLLIPPLLLGIMALTAMFYLTLFAEAWGVNAFRQQAFKIISSNINLKLKEGAFIKDFDGYVIYLDAVSPKSGAMQGIMVTDYGGGKNPRSIFAREGYLLKDPEAFKITLRLKEGSIHSPSAQGNKYHMLTFSENDLSLDMNKVLASSKRRLERKREPGLTEIRERLKALSEGQRPYYATMVEYHKKFSLPFAALLFSLMGAATGIRNQRLGRSGGLILSITIALIYYVVLAAGQGLGDENAIPPALAMWFPNMLSGGYCFLIVMKLNREMSAGIVDRIIVLVRAAVWRLSHQRVSGRG